MADLSRMKHMKWAELESGLEEIAGKAARLGVSGEEFVRLAQDAYGKAGESV